MQLLNAISLPKLHTLHPPVTTLPIRLTIPPLHRISPVQLTIRLQHLIRLIMSRIQPILLILILPHLPLLDLPPAQSQLSLRQPHTPQKPNPLLPLPLLPLLTPLQLLCHRVNDAGEGFQGRLGIEEGEARAPGQDIDGGAGVFVAAGVADFAVDEGVEGGDAGAADGVARVCGRAEGRDGPGAVAVVGAGGAKRLAWMKGGGGGRTGCRKGVREWG